MIYVLDSSAILRYLENETGAGRVAACITGHLALRDQIAISAVQWGEVASVLLKLYGESEALETLDELLAFNFNLVPATAERAQRAAFLKAELRLAYADAFAAELTLDSPEHTLITADFDFKVAAKKIKIEFLPAKSKP